MTTPLRNKKLSFAVKLAIVAGSAPLLAAGNSAFAQDDAAGYGVEEVVTTGSRIKRADIDSASPVTVLDRDDILAAGITDVGNLVQRMPSMSGSPIGTTTNNGGNGSVQIDLRGLGTNRTLTLVNGQRIVDGGDFQTIPATMIERVEILKDGASAVYGADAVAGVVNIITRQNFEGISLEAQTADFFDLNQGSQQQVGFIAGKAFEGGNVVFGAEFVKQEAAYQRDTPWDYFQDSYYIYPEGCEAQVAAPYDGSPTGGCYPIGSSRIPEGRLNTQTLVPRNNRDGSPRLQDWFNGTLNQPDNDGVIAADFDPAFGVPTFSNSQTFMNPDGTGLVPYDGRTYNYAPVNFIQTPYERTNLFGEANFDINEYVRFKSSVRANIRSSAQELAPQPYNSPTDPGYQGYYTPIDPVTGLPLREITGVDVDGDPVTYYTDDQGLGDVVTPVAYTGISPDNVYNTTGLAIRDARRRMVETTRSFEQDINQFQAIFGLEGTVADLDWDVSYNRGHRERIDQDFGQFNGPNLANAMGPSADLNNDGVPECYGDVNNPSQTLIPGCVPFNFFGGPGSVTQEMLDYVGINLSDSFVTELEELSFGVGGSAFELPGGELGWFAGYNYRREAFTFSPDSAKQVDQVTGNTGVGTDGSLYSTALFVEVLAPVFDNGTQSINLKGGVRYDDYNAFGDETTGQFGIEFQAMDSLKLRGTYGTVFRVPTISDLFAGQSDSFPTYNDPCIPAAGETLAPGCAQTGLQLDNQVLARVGGNPNLIPETGDTFTVGGVWTPSFGDQDVTLTVDYWDTQLDDGISSLGVQFILDDCYVRQNAASCALITRRADYSIAQILDGSLNVAKQGASGVDTEVRYNFDTGFGQFETSFLWAYLIERTKTPDPTSAEIGLQGRYTDPTAEDGGAYARNKINYSVQWYKDGLSVGYLGEYIHGLTADTFCNCGTASQYYQDIDSQLYHDLVASYDFGQGTNISMGITNLTDEAPPFIEIGFNASTDPSTYRLFGRGYYLRLSHSIE